MGMKGTTPIYIKMLGGKDNIYESFDMNALMMSLRMWDRSPNETIINYHKKVGALRKYIKGIK